MKPHFFFGHLFDSVDAENAQLFHIPILSNSPGGWGVHASGSFWFMYFSQFHLKDNTYHQQDIFTSLVFWNCMELIWKKFKVNNLLPSCGGIKQKHLPCHCQSVRFSNGWISGLHEEHITDETLCSGGWCWCDKLTLKPVTSNGIDVGLQTQDAYNQDFWSPWYWYSLTCSSLWTPFKGSMALPHRPYDRVFGIHLQSSSGSNSNISA